MVAMAYSLPLFLLLLANLSPLLAGNAVPAPPAPRQEFQALCERQRSGDHPYFGEAVVAELEGRLDSPGASPEVRAGVRGRLGQALLRLGRPAEAVARFRAALSISEAAGLAPELDRQLRRDLALALLQLGEDQNCVLQHRATSCILPITPEAAHRLPAAALEASDLYLSLLGPDPGSLPAADPEEVQLRWLFALSRMIAGEPLPEKLRLAPELSSHTSPTTPLSAGAIKSSTRAESHLPTPGLPDPAWSYPAWRDIAAELGVNALDLSGGAVMDDFDGDGLLDLISSTWDPCDHLKAFRNEGDGRFTDVSAAWGLDEQLGGLNLVHADYDGDGALDLLVLRGAWQGERGEVRNSLLQNRLHGERWRAGGGAGGDEGAGGRFVDVTRAAGVDDAFPTQTAAFADFDGDSDLDLFVGAEATAEHPYPSRLYRNEGDGTFTDVAGAAGVHNLRFAKAAAWGDIDDDGDPDLFVANIGPNRLYRNEGDGTFTDIAEAAGVLTPEVGFTSWFFDFDNDGDLDLFTADYGSPYPLVSASYLPAGSVTGMPLGTGHPRLYANHRGRFTDVSRQAGLIRPLLPMGANYGDLDNDGYLDIYLGTGVPDLEALMPNVMLHNTGRGDFRDVTFPGGFGHLQKGHGVAFGDLDEDGDQDLFQQMGGAYPVDAYFNALYENPTQRMPGASTDPGLPAEAHRWLTLHLEGRGKNRHAVGGRLEVRVLEAGKPRSIHLLVGSGGSFGGSSLRQEVGLGAATAIEVVRLRWPGKAGRVQEWRGLALDSSYLLIEGVEAARLLPSRAFALPAAATEDSKPAPHPSP